MRRTPGLCAALVLLLSLLAPAAALGRYDEVGGGATRITLDMGFLALMQRNGVKLSVRRPATLNGGVVSFPAVRGKLDPTTGRATVEHEGALILKGRRGFVSFKALQLKTSRPGAPLAAKVGGGQLKLGSAKSRRFARLGFGASYRTGTLTLAPKVAARLDKRLHLAIPTSEKTKLGAAVSRIQPEAASILGEGRATLELDPGFLAKLDRLHVAANPVFPAERPGPFTFEIFGGRLAPNLGKGALELRGGLELLQLGGGTVVWSDPRLDFDEGALEPEVDVEPAPPYAGKIGPAAVAALQPSLGAADPRKRTISLVGAGLTLGDGAAATMNEVFGRPQGEDNAFAAGEPVGRASFVAQAQ